MTPHRQSPEPPSYAEALRETTARHERLVQNLSILRQMDEIDDVNLDMNEICRRMVEGIASGLAVENCSLMLLDSSGEFLALRAACSPMEEAGRVFEEKDWGGRRFRIGEGVVGTAVAQGRAIRVDDVANESTFVRLSGSPVKVGSLMCFPLQVGGKTLGVLNLSHSKPGFFSVETERTLALVADRAARLLSTHSLYRRLQESEAHYRLVAENAGDGILACDCTGRITDVNPAVADITGIPVSKYANDEVAWESIVYPDDRERFLAHRARLLDAHTADTVEYRIIDASGNIHDVEERGTPLFDASGKILGIVSVVRDITDRKRAEEKREELDAQIRQVQKLESLAVLAGGVAHDFNNLLMGIMGNADLALMKLPSDSNVRERLIQIEKSAERAANLAKQMLAYSGRGKFVVRQIDLCELVRDMTQLLSVSVPKKARLTLDLSPQPPVIEGDDAQIRQVIMNLVTNASEALGEEGGVITITTRALHCCQAYLEKAYLSRGLPEGAYACIEVADTGCGMTKKTMERIFDPFFTTKFTGRGLGLAAVLGIVRGHNGAVRVESTPGKGTAFQVLLPCRPGPLAPKYEAPRPRRDVCERGSLARAWHGSGMLLLVDDEQTVREVGKSMLEEHGFAVLVAENGEAAVKLFREHAEEIAAVILDLTMPRMGGQQVLAALRDIREDVPVILSSGYNESDSVASFRGKGLSGFIQKPYVCDELLEKLREVLPK